MEFFSVQRDEGSMGGVHLWSMLLSAVQFYIYQMNRGKC